MPLSSSALSPDIPPTRPLCRGLCMDWGRTLITGCPVRAAALVAGADSGCTLGKKGGAGRYDALPWRSHSLARVLVRRPHVSQEGGRTDGLLLRTALDHLILKCLLPETLSCPL